MLQPQVLWKRGRPGRPVLPQEEGQSKHNGGGNKRGGGGRRGRRLVEIYVDICVQQCPDANKYRHVIRPVHTQPSKRQTEVDQADQRDPHGPEQKECPDAMHLERVGNVETHDDEADDINRPGGRHGELYFSWGTAFWTRPTRGWKRPRRWRYPPLGRDPVCRRLWPSRRDRHESSVDRPPAQRHPHPAGRGRHSRGACAPPANLGADGHKADDHREQPHR
jgi:hypothetical protein